jgi:ABC-type multidrug transport system fused ATPase/permease subunit
MPLVGADPIISGNRKAASRDTKRLVPPVLPPFRFSTITKLGKRYLSIYPTLLFLYIVGNLLSQAILPQQTTLYLGYITNHFNPPAGAFQSSASPGDAKPDVSSPKATVRSPAVVTHANLFLSRAWAPVHRLWSAIFDPGGSMSHAFWLWFSITIGLALALFGYQCLISFLDGKVSSAVRRDAFAAILKQSQKFFHERDSDRLVMILTQYCNQFATALRQLLLDPVLQIIAVGIIGRTIYVQLVQITKGQHGWTILGLNAVWVLFAVILLFALLSPWIVAAMGKYLQRDVAAVQEQNQAIATLVGGALKAPEEVQAMLAEGIFDQKHANLLARSLTLQMAQSVTVQKTNMVSGLPGDVVLAALLGLAIFLESGTGRGQAGTVITVALLTPLLMGAIQRLSGFGITVNMSWPNIVLISSFLESKSEIVSRPDAKDFDNVQPTLEARNIVFSYKPGERANILDGVSFSLSPGKITGFVARPGQGKTTFFRLALRFYDPQQGEILVGGIPHSAFTLHSLRRHIVLMSQFPAFFYDSTRENFLVAKPTATDEEIRTICEETGLWEILENSLGPNPLDEQFAAGASLSGGQKKLFALTRCLLRKPSFLFLDEPTTGMGPLEKFPMIDKMRAALGGKTVVVVDHDIIWQSRFCDRFFVLNAGRIVQEGSESELLSTPGLFKELHDEASQTTHAVSPGSRSERGREDSPVRAGRNMQEEPASL